MSWEFLIAFDMLLIYDTADQPITLISGRLAEFQWMWMGSLSRFIHLFNYFRYDDSLVPSMTHRSLDNMRRIRSESVLAFTEITYYIRPISNFDRTRMFEYDWEWIVILWTNLFSRPYHALLTYQITLWIPTFNWVSRIPSKAIWNHKGDMVYFKTLFKCKQRAGGAELNLNK